MFPIIKHHKSREKTKLLRKGKPQLVEKVSLEKAENIFLQTSTPQIFRKFRFNHPQWSKIDLSKEKKILRKVTLSSVKKGKI